MSTRRQFLGQSAAVLAGSSLLGASWQSLAAASEGKMLLRRTIPSSGESLPAIGMGTSGSFEITQGSPEYDALKEVLKRFFAAGATLIDTAPTYSNAEDILGPLLAEAKLRPKAFIATKLSGVVGRDKGLAQFQRTLKSLRTDKVELLQVHNLGDWKTQLALARELKQQGKVKYTGITHYLDSAQDQLADVVQETKPDFLQINYSVTNRGAEKRLFPMARDLGIAVLANRNFNDGKLFNQVKDKQLPGWASEVGVTSWAQMFLKFCLSHEAVTAVIPATGKPDRQSDNLMAGYGPLLSAAQKQELVQLVG
ncbi:aldo/keto reductase [Steroidobacter cummioxidans]|uniref:aldo/keto reductase n=1 Tax=Steroidobacter cummioxidans TaxID=1803913 RepID=UPI000E312F5D|nr:aldo/keto reductase [Steroidobacter cummioxidans]